MSTVINSYFHETDPPAEEREPGPEVEAQKAKLAQSGTISIYYYRIESTCLNKSFQAAVRDLEDPSTVHEKALKGSALSHTLR